MPIAFSTCILLHSSTLNIILFVPDTTIMILSLKGHLLLIKDIHCVLEALWCFQPLLTD